LQGAIGQDPGSINLVEGTFRCRRCGALRKMFWRGPLNVAEFRVGNGDWKTKAPPCNCEQTPAPRGAEVNA